RFRELSCKVFVRAPVDDAVSHAGAVPACERTRFTPDQELGGRERALAQAARRTRVDDEQGYHTNGSVAGKTEYQRAAPPVRGWWAGWSVPMASAVRELSPHPRRRVGTRER